MQYFDSNILLGMSVQYMHTKTIHCGNNKKMTEIHSNEE